MGIGRTNTGGGVGMNFRIVGGTVQPNSAKGNDIWVNTDKVESYVFSAIEPESPVAGMVWFEVGFDSSVAFNALKKNAVYVYPVSCNQYVDEEWVSVEAHIFQNGEWVQFSDIVTELVLYNAGDQCADITGGWETHGSASSILKEDHIYLMIGSGWIGRQAWTANPVDMSNYTTLNINVTEWSKLCYLGINDTKPKAVDWESDNFTNKDDCEELVEIRADGVVSMDISAVSGNFYVWLCKPGQNAALAGCKVTRVWLSN